MEAQHDFKELLALFNAHNVEYIVVGAYALAFHGAPRNTGDIDLLVRADEANARRIMAALTAFGFGATGIAESDFLQPERVVQLGVPPVRIDILTSLSGVTWEEVYRGRAPGEYGDVPVCFIGRTEYIKNKRATGRKKDEADIEAISEE